MLTQVRSQSFPLFNLGFRPFFLGASVFAVLSVCMWLAVYILHFPLPVDTLTMYQWHAHEMIYGYSLAVIAGFLLTAVKNWTGIQTIHGWILAGVFVLWVIARLLYFTGTKFIGIAAFFDLAFVFLLIIAVTQPVFQAKDWRRLGILSKLLLLAAGNTSFYMGVNGLLPHGVYWGIYGGLYLVISTILLMGGKVIPFFIERGVGYPVQLYNPRGLMVASLLLFLLFFIAEVFIPGHRISAYLAVCLFIINGVRLAGWHTPGIWKKPLLWGLYVAYLFIVTGFLLFALSAFTDISRFLALHAFAYGGIGIITVAMMGRVALGHTGRDVNNPPAVIAYSLLALIAGTFVRVGLPLVAMDHYVTWIAISQVLWIAAFLMFAIVYAPILSRSRIDGQFG